MTSSARSRSTSGTSEFKRACHGVGVVRNYSEQNLCRLIGPMGALLPIAHGPKREMKPRREFLLCQLQFLAQSGHRRHAARTSELSLAGWRTIRIGQRGAVALRLAHRIEGAPIALRRLLRIESKARNISFFHEALCCRAGLIQIVVLERGRHSIYLSTGEPCFFCHLLPVGYDRSNF